MLQWNQDALISLQEDLTVNVNVEESGMINHLTKVPPVPGKPSIGFLSRRETLFVKTAKEMEKMGKIIGMLLGKGDDAFQKFCAILEVCGYENWSETLKERARDFKKAIGIHFCLFAYVHQHEILYMTLCTYISYLSLHFLLLDEDHEQADKIDGAPLPSTQEPKGEIVH